MIDTHCHIDLYQNPTGVAKATEKAGVSAIVVTNLPSAYERAHPHVRQFKHLRLALGLHPLLAVQHPAERNIFTQLADNTFYIGEVGLDFSREGYATKELQIESFQFVLETLRSKPKFLTLHSRRAESQVLELLAIAGRTPVVFHWYSGNLTTLAKAISDGHYFSINPAMTQSPNGQKIISAIPMDRILTETDGPFVKIGNRIALPSDVAIVEEYLAMVWNVERSEAREYVKRNFFSSASRNTWRKPGNISRPLPWQTPRLRSAVK